MILGCWSAVLCAFPAAAGASASAAAAAPAADTADASGGTADFDRSMLAGSGQNTTDLSRFEHGNPVLPGIYNADVYLNNALVARGNVRLAAASQKASATPCADRRLLDMLGLHPKLSDALRAQLENPAACVPFDRLIPGARMRFDLSELRLDISVPQAYLGQTPRGYVSPEYWDAGMPAALLNYNFNSYHSSSRGLAQTSSYLGLNAGVNLGPWHLREDASANWQSANAAAPARHQWQNIDAYVQRDLSSLRAMLTIGDSFTDGAVFDSYGIRGVQLGTDDRMLPQSMQGYAPVVRGVAQSNAMVTVRQNGVVIYQTTVAPGPFSIDDLYPTGYGGNLEVTVKEADGSTSTFAVPYASVVQSLRPGVTRFDVAAGKLRDASIREQPFVAQATAQHGFNNLLTGYAGVVGSQGYAAALVGGALNTRYGAFAMDVTQAVAHIPGYATQSGQSVRLSYSKIIPSTQTTLSVAAYRYSTGGFLSLTQAAEARDFARRGISAFDYVPPSVLPNVQGESPQGALSPAEQATLQGNAFSTNPVLSATGVERQRNNFSLTLSQLLGDRWGSVYTNVSASDYWNRNGINTQFQVGYNNRFHRLNYGISATRSVDPLGHYRNEYFVSISLPLGSSSHAPTFTLNVVQNQGSAAQDQGMLTGSFGSDNQFNYSATASHGGNGSGNSGSVNIGYRSPYAVFGASYGGGAGYTQASVSASGAIVAHPGGVTFGQPMGDTVGIIYAPGAAGARVANAAGERVDRFGYALVPFLTPYNLNTVQLDPKGLPLDVQLDETSAQVAPFAGAVVMLKFKTRSGRVIIVRGRLRNGQPLPFGAEVFDETGASLGVVGQDGQILLRGVHQAGRLDVRWQDDNGANQSCSFPYALKKHQGRHVQGHEEISITCTPPTHDVAMADRSGT